MSKLPQVVIVGAGFAGLNAAQELAYASVEVTVVDRQNHHLFQPLLYQVATAALSAPDIAAPIRKILRNQQNATVLLGNVVDVDLDDHRVILEDGELSYDYLIVAAGQRTHYFGNDERWGPRAPALKTVDDALEVRRRILMAFEAAEREEDPDEVARWLTFVVIGAGPTGVEMAGALSEIARRTMSRNFRNFDPGQTRVILIEGKSEVMPNFPSAMLRRKARQQLVDLGVEIRLDTIVDDVTDDGVRTGDGTFIEARTVIWAAGVRGVDLGEALGDTDRGGRVFVEPDLSLSEHPDVFVVGDLAHCERDENEPVPPLAPAAIQMGVHAAQNVKRLVRDTEMRPFRYVDKGQMATIGRSRAIAKTGRFEFSGFTAWLAWLFIHIMYLVGFRNRVAVLLEWAYFYVTFQRSARVIALTAEKKRLPEADEDVQASKRQGAAQ